MDGYSGSVEYEKFTKAQELKKSQKGKGSLAFNRALFIKAVCDALGFKQLEPWMMHELQQTFQGREVDIEELKAMLLEWKGKQNGNKDLCTE